MDDSKIYNPLEYIYVFFKIKSSFYTLSFFFLIDRKSTVLIESFLPFYVLFLKFLSQIKCRSSESIKYLLDIQIPEEC